MCEIKCDNEELDYANRQNMHSCNDAIKTLLKLEQKTNQYRKNKKFESLLDKILVYSISHDQKNARLYEHFALIEKEKWTYYRHHIANFDIVYKKIDLLIFHDFARNVLTIYASKLLKRFRKAIAILLISSTLSFSASTMNLKNDSQQDFQQFSQNRDVEDFTTLVFSVSTQKLLEKQREQMKQQLAKQLESQKQKYDQQIKQMNLQLNALIKQMQSSEKRED